MLTKFPNIEKSWKYDAQGGIFREFPDVWRNAQTMSRVFDKSSQSRLKLGRKTGKLNRKTSMLINQIFKHRHDHNFRLSKLDELVISLRTFAHDL